MIVSSFAKGNYFWDIIHIFLDSVARHIVVNLYRKNVAALQAIFLSRTYHCPVISPPVDYSY